MWMMLPCPLPVRTSQTGLRDRKGLLRDTRTGSAQHRVEMTGPATVPVEADNAVIRGQSADSRSMTVITIVDIAAADESSLFLAGQRADRTAIFADGRYG